MNRVTYLLSAAISFVTCASWTSGTAVLAKQSGDVWLATISVSRYPNLPPKDQLEYCDNDARAMVERFVESKTVSSERLCQMRAGESSNRLPTKENIERELPQFLAKPSASDTVVLFFSMHGLQLEQSAHGGEPATFLMPADTEITPDRLLDTVIPIEWLRNQLHQTKAQRVILFLDACHAGGIKNSEGLKTMSPLTSKSFEIVFRDAPQTNQKQKIYVLASCRDRQSSLESAMLKHGIFTHWVTCGFDGAADSNADGLISMDELFAFVEIQVPKSVRYLTRVARGMRQKSDESTADGVEQNPVRFFFGNDQGDIVVMPIAPKPITTALKRTGEMLDVFLRSHLYRENHTEPARIGIVEFGLQSADGLQDLRGRLGSFGAISRDLLDKELTRLIDNSQVFHKAPVYRLAAGNELKKNLKGFNVNQVESMDVPAETLMIDGQPIDALLFGRYLRRGNSEWDSGPDRMELDLTLIDTRSKTKIARIQTVILVNSELLAMLGGSIDKRQNAATAPIFVDYTSSCSPANPHKEDMVNVPKPSPVHTPKPQTQIENRIANQESKVSTEPVEELPQPDPVHPQFNPENATMSIQVKQSRDGRPWEYSPWLPSDPTSPNDLIFETREGNEVALELTNNTEENLAFVVQIDGINQIGGDVATPDRSPYWHIKPRASTVIDQWLDPLRDQQVQGDLRSIGGRRLVISSAAKSVAIQSNLSENLGEIRIVVYGTRKAGTKNARARELGMSRGRETSNQYPVIRDLVINTSDKRAVYVLRYQAERP
jgi:hypothetical protein